MHEMILCKLGEVVLKGLNRRSFEDKLMSNVNRRVSKCGNFRVYSKQSTIYVEPKDDECDIEAAFESCKKVFGIIAVSKALPCEKDIQKIISAAKEYLACEMRTARSFKVESKRADKTFSLTSIQISQQVGGALHQAFPMCEVNVHDPELVVHIEIRDDAAYVHGPAEEGAGGLPIGMGGVAVSLLSGGIDLAVLELVNAILEGAVHRIDVVLGQTRSAEHLPGVDLGTGTNVTNADGLALEVGNGVDAGLGKDLNGLVVDTGDPKSVGLGSAVEGVGALVRVVDNVGLQNGHLSLAVGDHVDVRDGSAGGLNIEGGKGQLGVEDGLENAADSIVGTGGTAGRQSDRDGGIGAGVAVVVLAVVRLLTAAGDQREDHREREDQS